MKKSLVIIPTAMEFDYFIAGISDSEHLPEQSKLGKIDVVYFSKLDLLVAQGGLGKTQFGIQTQYLLDRLANVQHIFCVGACGALVNHLSVGDVIVSTETVEHDIKKFSRKMMPKFRSSEYVLERIKGLNLENFNFSVEFGPVASGDEDIMSDTRKSELRESTAAIAVAWEGAGGARACEFNGVDYVELRGVTDFSDTSAESDFSSNLEATMANLSTLVKSVMLKI